MESKARKIHPGKGKATGLRKPRVGEYFVTHDDPKYVFQVHGLGKYLNGELQIQFTNCALGTDHVETHKQFIEFFTRVPI